MAEYPRGFEHNTNDVTPHVTQFDARVSPALLARREMNGQDSLYPTTLNDGTKYQLAHKGNVAFTLRGMDGIPEDENDDNYERGMAYVASDLNGVVSSKYSDSMHLVNGMITPVGVWRDDILAQNTTRDTGRVACGGKMTMLNTGPKTIYRGQKIIAVPPVPDPQQLRDSGAGKVKGRSNHAAPLWVIPYDEKLHRATPYSIARYGERSEPFKGAESMNEGNRKAARTFLSESLRLGYAVIKALKEVDPTLDMNDDEKLRQLLLVQSQEDETNNLMERIRTGYLMPTENLDLADKAKLKQLAGGLTVAEYYQNRNDEMNMSYNARSYNSFLGGDDNDDDATANRKLFFSAGKLIGSVAYIERFYKPIGTALTTASPSNDFDVNLTIE